MLAFTARTWLRQKEEARKRSDRPRPTSAERRLGLGVDQRPKVRKKTFTFGDIFKEEISGVEVLHSQSERARRLARFGVWHDIDPTAPELRRWLRNWVRRGGLALL